MKFENQELFDRLFEQRKIRPHYNLASWKRAILLTKKIYQLTDDFPKQEQYGLTSQMRRASVSVALNIAEGSGRKSFKDNNRFLMMADSSLSELETCLIIALELNYIEKEDFSAFLDLCSSVSAPLRGLMKHLNSKT